MFGAKLLTVLGLFLCLSVINCNDSLWSGMGVSCGTSDVLIDIKDDTDGCQRLAVKVRFCKGTCRSATRFFPVFPYFKPLCECCAAASKETMPVELICPGGRRKITKIETIKECKCELCGA